jgi:hypothetical protein
MRLLDNLATRFAPRQLTRTRMMLAIAVAVTADALQIALLPVAWTFVQEIIDVVAMGLTILLLGFHVLLLPTFVIEFIPLVDMLPTWTGCVVAVLALRKRNQRATWVEVPPLVDASPTPKPPAQIGPGSSNQGTLPR